MRRVWYDWEFVDDGKTIDSLSLGMVRDDGEEYYAVVNDRTTVSRAVRHPWLRENVVPSLPVTVFPSGDWDWDRAHPNYAAVKSRGTIAVEVRAFLVPDGWPVALGAACELWAWFGAYDHVALAQLFGRMIDFPPGVPMFTHELVQRWEDSGRPRKPAQASGTQHNALADARWNRGMWQMCEAVRHPGSCRAGSGGPATR